MGPRGGLINASDVAAKQIAFGADLRRVVCGGGTGGRSRGQFGMKAEVTQQRISTRSTLQGKCVLSVA